MVFQHTKVRCVVQEGFDHCNYRRTRRVQRFVRLVISVFSGNNPPSARRQTTDTTQEWNSAGLFSADHRWRTHI